MDIYIYPTFKLQEEKQVHPVVMKWSPPFTNTVCKTAVVGGEAASATLRPKFEAFSKAALATLTVQPKGSAVEHATLFLVL